MAGYHFGWWDKAGTPTGSTSGKALRPALTLCAAAALGGAEARAVHAATAIELVHNFSLIHDDIMDADPIRRGRPTIWNVWSIADAILLGDALHALAARVLVAGLPGTVGTEAVSRMEAAVAEMCRGQCEDCSFENRRRVDVEEYTRMAMGKTGALMGCACALGALCAGAEGAAISAMDEFGRQLGLAFQFMDDLMGIWGDSRLTGKPANDLARRKLSLPVVIALGSSADAAAELAAIYQHTAAAGSADTERAAALIDDIGGRDVTQQHADQRVRIAIQALPDKSVTDDLMALALMVGRRDR
ncbi:polyprenyl synthetase family protein [Nocardia sp. NPDC051570]|uniref:polyprenyl synthetase family protein n=1 Tax=Nocardia sp. NPDC051570 TaxID=3364324 RepID=UPI003795C021